jgi:Spy/CpxP family protein refolding chaperone
MIGTADHAAIHSSLRVTKITGQAPSTGTVPSSTRLLYSIRHILKKNGHPFHTRLYSHSQYSLMEETAMKRLIETLLVTALVGGMMAPALAAEHGQGTGMSKHSMSGMGPGMHLGGRGWKATLSDEQRIQLARLRLDFKKKVYPLKARMQQTRIELALLISSDKPSQKSINKKIDALVRLKSEKMRLKAKHKIAVRKILTPEQRVPFDMMMLRKAYYGKRHHGGGHH